MRRSLKVAICVVLVGLTCAGAAASASRHGPTHLLINAQEWSMWPSRSSVPAGTVLVELWNRGQDMHDAWIRRVSAAGQMVGPVLGRVKVTMPGHVGQASWRLRAGHYEIFCSMPGHMKLGMHAKLTVMRA